LGEVGEKPNYTKISRFSNFERKGYKAKDSFLKPFSIGSKCLALDLSHKCRK
jgi:hypothetical protein